MGIRKSGVPFRRFCKAAIALLDDLEGLILRIALFALFVYGLVSLLLAHHR